MLMQQYVVHTRFQVQLGTKAKDVCLYIGASFFFFSAYKNASAFFPNSRGTRRVSFRLLPSRVELGLAQLGQVRHGRCRVEDKGRNPNPNETRRRSTSGVRSVARRNRP